MNIPLGGLRALVLAFCVLCLPLAFDGNASGQEKDKDSIKTLFDGIPADLRAKVRDNPVRCDRVNDWLKENVNGKGKAIEVRLAVSEIITVRSPDEGTYLVHLSLAPAKGIVLEDTWRLYFRDHIHAGPKGPFGRPGGSESRYSFSFEGLSTAEAEKLVDTKQVVIQGKVQEAKLGRSLGFGGGAAGTINFTLEDVRVEGKKWTKQGSGPVVPPKPGPVPQER